ncbi:MAG: carboxypeptidase-like regulatory domain-containing protein, partial [Bacillota bacterium]|nr:carboxypeptidase-like regulatory domain-containing protein [Bacillota bacterium]
TLDVAPLNVQGTVYDGNVPVANASVNIMDYSTAGTTNVPTDANGVFSVDLPDGNYSIDSVNVNGSNIYIYTDFTITNHIVYVNGLAQNQFAINLPPVVAQGDVVADGAPLANGTVWFYNLTTSSWNRADLGTNGQFSLRLPDGDYRVDSVDSSGLSNTVYLNTTFNVTNGILTVGGQTLSQLHIVLPSEVKGSLVDGSNNPLAGYTVNIQDVNTNYISTLTATDGSFGVRLTDGTYTVTDVMDPNGKSITVNKSFTVANGQLSNANDLALSVQP